MLVIEKLNPASPEDITIYLPYYGKEKQRELPYAISLYQKGSLEGMRRIEGGDNIYFVAFWNYDKLRLPSASNYCRLQFDGRADLTYEIFIANSELIGYLIDLLVNYKKSGAIDFPREFYRKLLRFYSA